MIIVNFPDKQVSLREFRASRGFKTVKQFAELSGVSKTAISLMESSNYKMTFERAVKMSIALGVDVEQSEYVDERIPIIGEKSEVNIFTKDKVALEFELNKMFGDKLAPIRCSRQSKKCQED